MIEGEEPAPSRVMSLNVTFGSGSILVLTFVGFSVTMASSFSFPCEVVVEVVLSPFASAEVEEMECLFDLTLVAARILCSSDDRKRLNVLSWTSGLTGGSEVLDEVDAELSFGSGSRAILKGLEIASCVRRFRTVEVMYVGHPEDERVGRRANHSANVTTRASGIGVYRAGKKGKGSGYKVRNGAESSLGAFRTRDLQRLQNRRKLPHATPRI